MSELIVISERPVPEQGEVPQVENESDTDTWAIL
jgi:hypothetical protein